MSSRRVASVTFVWNHAPFIIPHFNMISSLDHNFVFIGEKPLSGYDEEHGIPQVPDNSEQIIRENFPQCSIHKHSYTGYFCSDLYNSVRDIYKEYDIVLRLDPDMILTDDDWNKLIFYIRETDFDCYRADYSKCSINYYMDFDHGLKDAKEFDILAFNPKNELFGLLAYPSENQTIIDWDNFMIHHFRGWNKPKTVTKDWPKSEYAKTAFPVYCDGYDWYHCPQGIREKFNMEYANIWLNTLKP